MIKIEVAKETRKKINGNHRKYIEMTSVLKLEDCIERIRLPKKYEFFKTLFGNTPNSRKTTVIKYCLSENLENLLEEFNFHFCRIYGFEFSNTLIEEHKKIIKDTRMELDKIFNYGGFNVGIKFIDEKRWSRHEFIKSLGIKVCPYCNRQYITSYEDIAVGSRTTADADHYYPKAEFPVLQMNIFNLIPSCSVCNSRMKGTSNKRHLYPYKDPSNSLIFEIPLEADDRVSEILIDPQGTERAKASIDVFRLDKIYQAHLDEASEVKQRAEEYFKYYENAYEATYGLKVPFNIYDTWFSYLGKAVSAEPLVKLKKDIFNQLYSQLKK